METSESALSAYAPDFELPGTDGEVHHLSRYLETHRAVAVVFLSNTCPYVLSSLDRLKQLQAKYQSQDFMLIGINANDAKQSPGDDFEQMKLFATQHQLNFPYVRDHTQDVAESFGATVTPEVFLIDNKAIIRYRVSIDAPQSAYLEKRIQVLLENETIEPQVTTALGSAIHWRQ